MLSSLNEVHLLLWAVLLLLLLSQSLPWLGWLMNMTPYVQMNMKKLSRKGENKDKRNEKKKKAKKIKIETNLPRNFFLVYYLFLSWLNLNLMTIYLVNRLIGLVGRVFASGLGDLGSIPSCVISKTLKMVLDTSLLNTQQYKVRIKGKVELTRERSSALPYTSVW